jgi:hypothetical protein
MCVLDMTSLDVESIDDLRRRLREVGHYDDAIKEILKWYKRDSSGKRV